ncbi:MAG TPA: nucleoside monophosphate kinase, partial [Candidatus Paceibacterota bacterium]
MELQTIVFLGPQGSGKGTQVELLAKFLEQNDPAHPTFHFSVGELLREFGLETGYTEARVHESLLGGNMQPSFISSYLVARFFIRHLEGREHLILDGYPRSPENIVSFDSAMQFYGRVQPTLIYLTLPDEESV